MIRMIDLQYYLTLPEDICFNVCLILFMVKGLKSFSEKTESSLINESTQLTDSCRRNVSSSLY